MVSVVFGPKTGGSILQKSLMDLENRLSVILGHRIHSGIPLKQLHQRNNSQCLKPVFCLSCANNKEKKHSILYEVHCIFISEKTKANRDKDKEGLD